MTNVKDQFKTQNRRNLNSFVLMEFQSLLKKFKLDSHTLNKHHHNVNTCSVLISKQCDITKIGNHRVVVFRVPNPSIFMTTVLFVGSWQEPSTICSIFLYF